MHTSIEVLSLHSLFVSLIIIFSVAPYWQNTLLFFSSLNSTPGYLLFGMTHLKHNKSCLNSGLNTFGGTEDKAVATIYIIFFRLSKLNLWYFSILSFYLNRSNQANKPDQSSSKKTTIEGLLKLKLNDLQFSRSIRLILTATFDNQVCFNIAFSLSLFLFISKTKLKICYWYSVSSDGDFKINRSKPPD
ncbi:hypothetical protein BpHYR1_001841 [Brachionus plicatilis]|uniref:Uncharacterized protein n=1 Tax=Brachionus plicatilis TaxID=10195 RepID=A0A3M7QVC9_BRAPC|nr:hypothetical protein BpHYR1_001841 [Brachionus plicatilis]